MRGKLEEETIALRVFLVSGRVEPGTGVREDDYV